MRRSGTSRPASSGSSSMEMRWLLWIMACPSLPITVRKAPVVGFPGSVITRLQRSHRRRLGSLSGPGTNQKKEKLPNSFPRPAALSGSSPWLPPDLITHCSDLPTVDSAVFIHPTHILASTSAHPRIAACLSLSLCSGLCSNVTPSMMACGHWPSGNPAS